MQRTAKKKAVEFVAGACLIVALAGLGSQSADAQQARRVAVAATSSDASAQSASAPQGASRAAAAQLPYFVDFRSRTAASYGHAFVWYGRTGQKKVTVAGLHPATDSMIPYVLGHIIPVPAETGASYGDLDEQYLTASYRIYLTEAQASLVFAYIKQKQANSPLWNAATYNCIVFISDIARFMGMTVPTSHLLYPDEWVKELAALNRGRKTVRIAVAR